MPALELWVVRDWNDLAARWLEWNELVAQSDTNMLFQSFEWHASWLQAFGQRVEPLVIIAAEGDCWVGIAPLMRVRRWFWGGTRRVIEFIGKDTAGSLDLIVRRNDESVRALFFDWLIENQNSWDALDWTEIPEGSPTLRAAENFFRDKKRRTHTRILSQLPTRRLIDLRADRAATRTPSLRWHRNRLRRQGQLEFRRLTRADEALPYLDIFFEMHIRRRAITALPSFFNDPAFSVFYRALFIALAEKEYSVLDVALLDQIPIAIGISFEHNRRLFLYQHTFDLDYRAFSPGTLLVNDLLSYALERECVEYNLGPGDQPYKYLWANQTQSSYAVRVFHSAFDYWLMSAIVGLKMWVSRSPRALAKARRLAEILGIAQPLSRLN